MNLNLPDLHGMQVTIMGLGLHGGGSAATRFFAEHGAKVTVTDLRKAHDLKPALDSIKDLNIRYILGKHNEEDFINADLVIKNPAVPPASPLLRKAKQIETDISLFLMLNKRPLIAVTGSKGKSTSVSALHHVLQSVYPLTELGGNITTSPLTFIKNCFTPIPDPVILELSSWQLGDIKDKHLLDPNIALITNILHDHQNSYSSMKDYISDKQVICQDQSELHSTICNFDDPHVRTFAQKTQGRVFYFSSTPLPPHIDGAFIDNEAGFFRLRAKTESILPKDLMLPGKHNRLNLLGVAAALTIFDIPNNITKEKLAAFKGIEHRLEFVVFSEGVEWYNDSAATIPEATLMGLTSFTKPIVLITGGTNKELDFKPLETYISIPKHTIFIAGSATDIMVPLFAAAGASYSGPYDTLEKAVIYAQEISTPGDVVLFSPAGASFEMFNNEFHRGKCYKELVTACTS